MKEIGEYLRETRVNNGVGIEEAAEDLNMAASQVENIESGNVRAFKDVFSLKELVREYAKYLGLDPDKVLDEFNDFMFEHTSKISLDDIKEAKNLKAQKESKPENKIGSPYTKIPKKKKDYKPLLIGLLVVVILFLFLYLVIRMNNRPEKINQELLGRESVVEWL